MTVAVAPTAGHDQLLPTRHRLCSAAGGVGDDLGGPVQRTTREQRHEHRRLKLNHERSKVSTIGATPVDPFDTPAGRAHLAAQKQERAARGAEYGLTAEQVEAADRTGMSLDRYAAYAGKTTVTEFEEAAQVIELGRQAKQVAALQALVDAEGGRAV
jgi:hypothetical protein